MHHDLGHAEQSDQLARPDYYPVFSADLLHPIACVSIVSADKIGQ